jgi:isoquinoline 1-oxidoreductase alpha subunit
MITLNVNGTTYSVNVAADTPLLWTLRDVLGLTGTKYGCGIEVCGACMVLVDGEAKKSCDIVTIEGLSKDRSHPAQKAWIANQVPQCGYCQSGMIIACAGALAAGHHGKEIVSEINNVCICGTYQRVKAAASTL